MATRYKLYPDDEFGAIPAIQRILLSAIFNTKKNLKLADIQSNRMLAYKSNAIGFLSQI